MRIQSSLTKTHSNDVGGEHPMMSAFALQTNRDADVFSKCIVDNLARRQ